MIKLKHKDGQENIFEIRGKGDLLLYFFWRCQGYVRGFMGDHIAIRLISKTAFLMSVLTVGFLVFSSIPGIWKFPKDTENIVIAPVAQAAEEATETDPPEGSNEKEPEEPIEEPESVVETAPTPLDDSLMEPSDVYVESGHPAVFKAYHPQAEDYQWEIYDTEKGWEKAPAGSVADSQDELLREISSLQITSDKDQSIRCQISTVNGTPLTYEAKLHVLTGEIKSIAADELKVQAGEYVSAMDIPVQVTYQDGSQDEITGLSGLYFMEQTESTKASTTESGNLQETITTVRTACEYDHVEDMGSQEGLLCYKPSGETSMDIPIAITGVDKTPPQITSLTVDGYEVTNIDQTVPVTVTIRAIDDVTQTRQLEYAFLPAEMDVQEAEWTKDASFTAEIDKNGIWTAYVKDESGNIASTERDLVVVDNKAPIVDLRLESQGWCKENKIFVSAEDALPVQYRYLCEETGEDSGWIGESIWNVTENGAWKIQVKDALGNVAEKTITIEKIDSKPPVIRSIKEKIEKESVSNEK